MQAISKYSHAILLALGLIALWAYGCENRKAGRLQQELHDLQSQAKQIDTVYRTDTIALRKVRYRTDSLLITDTVIHTDTVRQIVQQEREACNAVVSTCEQEKANLRKQITVLQKQKPNWIERRFGCTAGVAATTKGAGLGASCGIRFP